MIGCSLLVVCALQGVSWGRTVGGAGQDLLAVGDHKASVVQGTRLWKAGTDVLSGLDNHKGSDINAPVDGVSEASSSKSVGELLMDSIRELVHGNVTGDINGAITQKSLTKAAEEFTNDLKEWIKDDEGRHFKRHKMMARMALWLKTLLLGVVLPGAVAVALFAAWKGITLSLMALLLAGIVGIKGLVSSAKTAGPSPQHVVVSGLPSHHHHEWRRHQPLDSPGWSDSAHHLAYRAYSS